jgi:hypothetical protein
MFYSVLVCFDVWRFYSHKCYRKIEYHSYLIRDNYSDAFGRNIWKSALGILSTCFLEIDKKLSHSALLVTCYVRFWYSVSVTTLSNILWLFNFNFTSLKISRYVAIFATKFHMSTFFLPISLFYNAIIFPIRDVNFLPKIAFFPLFISIHFDSIGAFKPQ